MNNVNSVSGLYTTDTLTPAFSFAGSVNVPAFNLSAEDTAILDKQTKEFYHFKESLINLFSEPTQIKALSEDPDFIVKVKEKNKLFNEEFLLLKKLVKDPFFNLIGNKAVKDKLSKIYYELADLKLLSENLYKEICFINNKNKKVYSSKINFNDLLEVAEKVEKEMNKYKE